MKATREQVLAMARKVSLATYGAALSLTEEELAEFAKSLQQFTLDQIRAEGPVCAFLEIDCPECKKKEGREHDVPFPGMQEEFEAYYSQSFIDRDWRREAGVWAASWKAATRYTAPPDQTAEIERLRNLSACEACAEIPSVMEYFKQCEERIATLESALRNLLNAVNDRYAAQHHGLLVLGGSAIDEAKAALGEE